MIPTSRNVFWLSKAIFEPLTMWDSNAVLTWHCRYRRFLRIPPRDKKETSYLLKSVNLEQKFGPTYYHRLQASWCSVALAAVTDLSSGIFIRGEFWSEDVPWHVSNPQYKTSIVFVQILDTRISSWSHLIISTISRYGHMWPL